MEGLFATVDNGSKRRKELDGHLKIDFLPMVQAQYEGLKDNPRGTVITEISRANAQGEGCIVGSLDPKVG